MNDRRNSRVDYHAFFADALGRLHTERRYRVFADLERIAGRYADIDRERDATRTVYALNPPQRVDVWTLLRRLHQYLPWVDTLYGSAAFMPMADGARYEVKVSQIGLVARPLNLAAQQAVGAWH